jgi:hypothetical protein
MVAASRENGGAVRIVNDSATLETFLGGERSGMGRLSAWRAAGGRRAQQASP